MALANPFKLEKLKIEAYADAKRKPPAAKSMEVMFNPNTYKRTATIEYAGKNRRPIGSPSSEAKYAYTPPAGITFEFIFDGTGAAFFGAEHLARLIRQKSVKEDIKTFEELCLKTNGNIHEPNFLKVVWGNHLDFPSRLTALDISYELFDEGGDPLRAKLNATFTEDIPAETSAKAVPVNSPDLTHVRVVKSGDTLPLLCKEIYGSSRYYLKVAADNGLDDFRNLVPGQKLHFPPLT
jgi:hypothetical protein